MPDRYRIAGALSSPMRPCVGASVDAAVCVRAGAGALLGSGICCDAAACCCCCDADLLLCCCFRSPSTGGQRCATSPACRTRSTLH